MRKKNAKECVFAKPPFAKNRKKNAKNARNGFFARGGRLPKVVCARAELHVDEDILCTEGWCQCGSAAVTADPLHGTDALHIEAIVALGWQGVRGPTIRKTRVLEYHGRRVRRRLRPPHDSEARCTARKAASKHSSHSRNKLKQRSARRCTGRFKGPVWPAVCMHKHSTAAGLKPLAAWWSARCCTGPPSASRPA